MNVKKIFFILFHFLALIILATHNLMAGAWNDANNPQLLLGAISSEKNFSWETDWSKLPLQGELSPLPWTDDYWPNQKRGLARRWQGNLYPKRHADESQTAFYQRRKKKSHFTLEELFFMSEEERNKLSPAEKMDIINGDMNYTLTEAEMKRTSPYDADWEGLCHGWAQASLNYLEPGSCLIEVDSTLGTFQLPFVSSDIKALLSLMQGNYSDEQKEFVVGTRCNVSAKKIAWKVTVHSNDINAGAFHLLLSNFIARLNRGFVIDRVKDMEVWNHPVEKFSSQIIKEQGPDIKLSAPGTVKELEIETTLYYVDEIKPNVLPMNQSDRSLFSKKLIYHYILELDQDQKIIGGRWLSQEYPDFVWIKEKAPFQHPFEKLEKIYQKSRPSL